MDRFIALLFKRCIFTPQTPTRPSRLQTDMCSRGRSFSVMLTELRGLAGAWLLSWVYFLNRFKDHINKTALVSLRMNLNALNFLGQFIEATAEIKQTWPTDSPEHIRREYLFNPRSKPLIKPNRGPSLVSYVMKSAPAKH